MTPNQRRVVDAVLLAAPDRLERVVALELARIGYGRTVGTLLIGESYETDPARIRRLQAARALAWKGVKCGYTSQT